MKPLCYPASKKMRCIFCKNESNNSSSQEHFIPQSLGNTEHILPPGLICDSCNNYFARKIERPVLGSPMFRLLRADRLVPNKRGKVPKFLESEEPGLPDFRLMSRLIAKIALAGLAFRTLSVPGWNDELTDKPELDEIRSYARFNIGETWPFAYRTLYPVNAIFEEDGTFYEVLHEFDFLYTSSQEMYFVIALFGVEFAMNLGGRVLDGYSKWLSDNGYISPLYPQDAA
jgi:hypothetical protein